MLTRWVRVRSGVERSLFGSSIHGIEKTKKGLAPEASCHDMFECTLSAMNQHRAAHLRASFPNSSVVVLDVTEGMWT